MDDTVGVEDDVDGLVRVTRRARQYHFINLWTERAHHKASVLDTPNYRGHFLLFL